MRFNMGCFPNVEIALSTREAGWFTLYILVDDDLLIII